MSNLWHFKLKIDLILDRKTKHFPDYETLKCKLSKTLWLFSGKCSVLKNQKILKLGNGQKGVKRESYGWHAPCSIPFSGEPLALPYHHIVTLLDHLVFCYGQWINEENHVPVVGLPNFIATPGSKILNLWISFNSSLNRNERTWMWAEQEN